MTDKRANRKVKLQVWLTQEEHELLNRAAITTGQGMSSYVRSNVLKAIREDLKGINDRV